MSSCVYVKRVNWGGLALIKSAYTDEEIKNVFQALFVEKKRLKEMEQQLDALRKSSAAALCTPSDSLSMEPLIEENNQLKCMLATLTNKYEEAVNAAVAPAPNFNSDQATLQKSLNDSLENQNLLREENLSLLSQLKQLKSLVLKAQSDAEQARATAEKAHRQAEVAEAHLKDVKTEAAEAFVYKNESSFPVDHTQIQLLQQSVRSLETSLHDAEEQNQRQKIHLERLAHVLQEKDKKIQELHQYELTYKKTAEHRQMLQSNADHIKHENEQLKATLSENLQHNEQLERVIQFLRKRSEEEQLASEQFNKDFESSQESILRLQKELNEAHELINKLRHSALHIENEKLELEKSLTTVKAELELAQQSKLDYELGHQKLDADINALELLLKQEQENSISLAQQLKEQTSLAGACRKEIDNIKQALVRGMREANELEIRFKETVQEKINALNKFHHIRQQLEKQDAENKRLQEDLKHVQLTAKREREETLALHNQKEDSQRALLEQAHKALQHAKMEALAREERNHTEFELYQKQMNETHLNAIEALNAQTILLKEEHLEEKERLNHQIYSLKVELEKFAGVEADRIAILEQYERVVQELHSSNEKYSQSLQNFQNLEDELKTLSATCEEKDRDKNEAHEQLNRMMQEKHQLHTSLNSSRVELEEKDSHLKMAQQHLAKKVKETALFAEEVEKYKHQMQDFQQQNVQLKIRSAELQTSLEIHMQQEARLNDQIAEVVKNYNSQVKNWEDKFLEMQDRWQATEIRRRELEKLEEKHAQMQALLANFGSVLSGTVGASPSTGYQPVKVVRNEPTTPNPTLDHSTSHQCLFNIEEEKVEHPSNKPYSDLFSLPKPSDKPRQNLFD